MKLLRRNRPDAAAWNASAAADFWAWWATAREAVAESIEADTVASFVGEIGSRVDAIHPKLDWELGSGTDSEHVLVISAGGLADMRAIAERVVRTAPRADPTWEYASARPPYPDVESAKLEVDDTTIEVAATRFVTTYDQGRVELDIRAYNPAWVELGRENATRALFLIVDWTLGEDVVEQWIGEIGVQLGPPEENEGVSFAGLRQEVETLASTTEPFWVVLEAEGKDMVVVARRPLKRPEFPLFDMRLDVSVALGSTDLGPAQDLDDEVVRLLGADGMHAASVSIGGRSTSRTSLFYCDAERVSVSEVGAAAQAFAPQERVKVEAELDPGWEAVRDYR